SYWTRPTGSDPPVRSHADALRGNYRGDADVDDRGRPWRPRHDTVPDLRRQPGAGGSSGHSHHPQIAWCHPASALSRPAWCAVPGAACRIHANVAGPATPGPAGPGADLRPRNHALELATDITTSSQHGTQ